jgi:cephalosporin hydroxylase
MKQVLKKIYKTLKGEYNSRYVLNEYGKKYKTDKINEHHSFAGKNYLDIYDFYFSPLKNLPTKMLEIGIREGSSLRTFRDYFKNGYLLGLDINPETAFTENRITTYIGSQSSPELIDKIFSEHPVINIVLDDGSHVNELTIASFNLIFNKLPSGSFYVIEDLACTYLEDELQGDIIRGGWPGMALNDSSIEMVNRREDMDKLFQKLIKDLDYRNGEVEFIHFWSQVCVIKKK